MVNLSAETGDLSRLHYVPPWKYLTPVWRMIRLGPLRLLMVQPNDQAYGRFIADIAVSMWVCIFEKASLFFVCQSKHSHNRMNPALLRLCCRNVTIVSPASLQGRFAAWIWMIAGFPVRLPGRLVDLWRRVARRAPRLAPTDYRPYVPRRVLKQYLPTYLPAPLLAEAERQARNVGVDPHQPMVTLHVRESGHDISEGKDEGRVAWRARRNATVENYLPAIEYLTDRGFVVVRLGDPNMSRLNCRGIIDLPHLPNIDYGLLEVLSLLRSRFFISTDSGPYYLPFLSRTPMLMTNSTLWWINYPLRHTDRYILKHVFDRKKNALLTLAEILDADFTTNDLDLERFQFIENTSDEILAATIEFEELVDHPIPMTVMQKAYQRKAHEAIMRIQHEAGDHPRIMPSMAQWGPDHGFLGDGSIAHSYMVNSLRESPELHGFFGL